jgi:DMSO/TMAO reductase YedYZ molybdopterin-dependent catalytic subunit
MHNAPRKALTNNHASALPGADRSPRSEAAHVANQPQGDVARLIPHAWIMRATNATPHRGRAAQIPAFAKAKERAMPQSRSLTRRHLIARLAAAGFSAPAIASIVATGTWAQDTATPVAEELVSPFTTIPPNDDPAASLTSIGIDQPLIPRGGFNFGTPPDLVDGMVVPNNAFFIRSHGPSAQLDDLPQYSLKILGHVDTPLTLTFDDLKALPQRTYQAFLECSGNGRGFFSPAVKGGQWRNDAIGNAEWTGVLLHDVLAQAGIKAGAVDVVSHGGDFPEMQRGLPVDIAMGADTLLALQMNGDDLPAPHGGPVRLFVPGWGGIASTKWLIGLTVIDQPFQGEFNVENYIVIDELGTTVRPVRQMPVSSAIWSPADGAEVPAGSVTISGYAWSGLGGIVTVEVSTDNGITWNEATITDSGGILSWARFESVWDAVPGAIGLLSRATDDRGTMQPGKAQWNQLGYQYNATQRVQVTVTS